MTTGLHEQLRESAGLGPVTHAEPEPDEPHGSGEDRYAVYSVLPQWNRSDDTEGEHHAGRKRIATTSAEGIGLCLVTLREEEQITNDSRVGILDRQTRKWIINPWAKGDAA